MEEELGLILMPLGENRQYIDFGDMKASFVAKTLE